MKIALKVAVGSAVITTLYAPTLYSAGVFFA